MIRLRRVLVTGSRQWTDVEAVYQSLFRERITTVGMGSRGMIVVHGACPTGADAIADAWAEAARTTAKVQVERHPADWATHGKAAGMIRNQEMVNLGADICLAFPLRDSRGTTDCMRRAMAAGIPVLTVSHRPLADAQIHASPEDPT